MELSENATPKFLNVKKSYLHRNKNFCSLNLVENEVQRRGGERFLLVGTNLLNSTFRRPYEMLSLSESPLLFLASFSCICMQSTTQQSFYVFRS